MIVQEDYQQAYLLLSQAVEIKREIGNRANLLGNLAALVRVEKKFIKERQPKKTLWQMAESILSEIQQP